MTSCFPIMGHMARDIESIYTLVPCLSKQSQISNPQRISQFVLHCLTLSSYTGGKLHTGSKVCCLRLPFLYIKIDAINVLFIYRNNCFQVHRCSSSSIKARRMKRKHIPGYLSCLSIESSSMIHYVSLRNRSHERRTDNTDNCMADSPDLSAEFLQPTQDVVQDNRGTISLYIQGVSSSHSVASPFSSSITPLVHHILKVGVIFRPQRRTSNITHGRPIISAITVQLMPYFQVIRNAERSFCNS